MKAFDLWKDLSSLILEVQEFVKENDLSKFTIESTILKRASIRNKVQNISDNIRKLYNAKIAKYCIFGLVVWLDEIMSEPYEQAPHPWPILQQEIFKTTEGGVVFYEYLDEVILNPFYPRFIYQFYYCMLKGGYKGKYVQDSQYVIQNYLTRLEEILGYNSELKSADKDNINYEPFVGESRSIKILQGMKLCLNKYYTLFAISGLGFLYLLFLGILYV